MKPTTLKCVPFSSLTQDCSKAFRDAFSNTCSIEYGNASHTLVNKFQLSRELQQVQIDYEPTNYRYDGSVSAEVAAEEVNDLHKIQKDIKNVDDLVAKLKDEVFIDLEH